MEKTEKQKEEEMAARVKKAEKMTDEVEKDLFIRYNMDSNIWRKAQRNYFPYNVSIDLISGVPLVAPLAFLVFDMAVLQ